MSTETLTTISPSTNKPILTRQTPTEAELTDLPKKAQTAFRTWSKTPLPERQEIVRRALEFLTSRQNDLAQELTEQMGRPIAYTAKEITTAAARGEYMLRVSEECLKDTPGEAEEGFERYIRKMPLGVVLVVFAWNVSTQSNLSASWLSWSLLWLTGIWGG